MWIQILFLPVTKMFLPNTGEKRQAENTEESDESLSSFRVLAFPTSWVHRVEPHPKRFVSKIPSRARSYINHTFTIAGVAVFSGIFCIFSYFLFPFWLENVALELLPISHLLDVVVSLL